MSAVRWADREERVSFREDRPKVSESLREEQKASSLLDKTHRVEAAGRSGVKNHSNKEMLRRSPLDEPEGHEPDEVAGVGPAGNKPWLERHPLDVPPKWQTSGKRGDTFSALRPSSIAAARRDVDIRPGHSGRSTVNSGRGPGDSAPVNQGLAATVTRSYTDVLPVNGSSDPSPAPAMDMMPSASRSHSAPLRQAVANGVIRRTVGRQGFVRRRVNDLSLVNEVSSRWIQDDPSVQGMTTAVRGSVQAATAVSNTVQFGVWSWKKSYDLIKTPVGFIAEVRVRGLIPTVVNSFTTATKDLLRMGAALASKLALILLAVIMVVFIVLMPYLNLIAAGTDMSFGVQGDVLDELYDYCATLDATWTVRVNQALQSGSSDEVRLNGSPLSGPFEVKTNIPKLLLYLQVKNATSNQSNTIDDLKRQIDDIYASMYNLSSNSTTETVTETRTIHAGESIGTVVTSAYCNCALCCGQWAGGPTASGVYPTSNHTLAVDAYTPTVPMGTEIIMNGTLYKVEDTGAFSRYGVDFDVYMDSHEEANNWGHRSFEAYLAGGNGSEIEIAETHTVSIHNVDFHTTSLYELTQNLTAEQQEHMDLINEFGQFAGYAIGGNPFGEDSHWNISKRFGDYADGTSIRHRDNIAVNASSGREVYAPLDGIISWSGSKATITKTDYGVTTVVKLSGLSSCCSDGPVAAGTQIGTANGEITIKLTRNGTVLNPAIYLANAPGNGDGQALVDMALTQLGQRGGRPYWSFFGKTSRDEWCSEFVSWCANECGFVDAGIIPKYSYSGNGIRWFRERGQWQPGGYVPNPGDVIFFDWDHDGQSDHTGIVEYCDGSTVYTVEGNVGDVCKKQRHDVNSHNIMGYGTPDYS